MALASYNAALASKKAAMASKKVVTVSNNQALAHMMTSTVESRVASVLPDRQRAIHLKCNLSGQFS